jgi:ElaB/YqjD/DUF883 family membrane-anchored ribosome-binding protein
MNMLHFDSAASATDDARDRILADLRALAADGETLIRATADVASEKAKEARARLNIAIEKARSTYEDLQAQGIGSVKAAAHKADNVVREHPYETAGVAFGFGLLLGALLARK